MATWVLLEDFAKATGQSEDDILDLCDEGKLSYKLEDEQHYIEAANGTQVILGGADSNIVMHDPEFAEHAINAIVALHDKVIEAKDETIGALKSENTFLKEALLSTQEVHENNQTTIQTLQDELKAVREDLEFSKRKYKLMWDQTVQTHATKA